MSFEPSFLNADCLFCYGMPQLSRLHLHYTDFYSKNCKMRNHLSDTVSNIILNSFTKYKHTKNETTELLIYDWTAIDHSPKVKDII